VALSISRLDPFSGRVYLSWRGGHRFQNEAGFFEGWARALPERREVLSVFEW